jgi:hypothetical protein
MTTILRYDIPIYAYVLRICTMFPINIDETADDGQDRAKHIR